MNKNRNLTRAEYKNLITEFSKMSMGSNQYLLTETIAETILGSEIGFLIRGTRMAGIFGSYFGPANNFMNAIKPPMTIGNLLKNLNHMVTKVPTHQRTRVAQALVNHCNKLLTNSPFKGFGSFTASGEGTITFQSAISGASGTIATVVGFGSILGAMLSLGYAGYKWATKSDVENALRKGAKVQQGAGRGILREDASLKGKVAFGGTNLLVSVKDSTAIGQSILAALEYVMKNEANEDGTYKPATMRASAAAPEGIEHKNAARHLEDANTIIRLTTEKFSMFGGKPILSKELIEQRYNQHFIDPLNEKIRKINADIKSALDNPESETEEEQPGESQSDKVGATKADKFTKYAGNDKLKKALVAAFKKAFEEEIDGVIQIESLPDPKTGERPLRIKKSEGFNGYVKLYNAVKNDKDLNPDGDHLTPQFFLNLLKRVYSKRLTVTQEILDNEGVEGINESLSRGSLYRRRYYGRY